MQRLSEKLERKLTRLGTSLIDPKRARVLVEPTQNGSGFWFGGGNTVRNPSDGGLLLIGRYRDAGDSRTGLSQGPRGRELAIFRSIDDGRSFSKIRGWDKSDLYCGSTTLSIEGSTLRINKRRVEVLVSTERVRSYPRGLTHFQKPGTGVWSIDTFGASNVEKLSPQENIKPLLASSDPAYLHIKDPNLSPGFGRNQYLMLYCAHPYTWSSSTSGWAQLAAQECKDQNPDFFPRGSTWDVSACRITCRLPLPRTGAFAKIPPLSLYFYDGAECLRPLEDHKSAISRPRGYSCEELGGLAYGLDRDFPHLTRLSRLEPLFVSDQGTGCNRYVSVLPEADGHLFATWQRSNDALAQPLLGHRLSPGRVASILS
jgi:hypothetical protein